MSYLLKQLRDNKGVTQVTCSEETGIPLRTLKRYEAGNNIGCVDYLLTLAAYYNVDPYELINRNEVS